MATRGMTVYCAKISEACVQTRKFKNSFDVWHNMDEQYIGMGSSYDWVIVDSLSLKSQQEQNLEVWE